MNILTTKAVKKDILDRVPLIKILLEKNELMEQNIYLIKNQNDSNEIKLKEIQFSKNSNKQGINETRK